MAGELAYTMIFGKPLLFWLGLTTMAFLLVTVSLGLMVIRGKVKFKYHKMMAFTLLGIGIVHAAVALTVYL